MQYSVKDVVKVSRRDGSKYRVWYVQDQHGNRYSDYMAGKANAERIMVQCQREEAEHKRCSLCGYTAPSGDIVAGKLVCWECEAQTKARLEREAVNPPKRHGGNITSGKRQYVVLKATGKTASGRDRFSFVALGAPGEDRVDLFLRATPQDPFGYMTVTRSACKRAYHAAYEDLLDFEYSEATGGKDRRKRHDK